MLRFRPILIFEVEEVRFPLESDGTEAIYWNFSGTNLTKPVTLPLHRFYLLFFNKYLMPLIKKAFFELKKARDRITIE